MTQQLAVYTTVYPAVEKFLAHGDSITRQSDSNFDLWIGIDSLSIDKVRVAIGKNSSLTGYAVKRRNASRSESKHKRVGE
jgi:hypothetical protein